MVINLTFALLRKAENKTFYILMTCGLIFAMLGDVVINHYFVPSCTSTFTDSGTDLPILTTT